MSRLLDKYYYELNKQSLDALCTNKKKIDGYLTNLEYRKAKVTEARKIGKSIAEKQKTMSKNATDPIHTVLNEEIRSLEGECVKIQKDLQDSKPDLLRELRCSANDRMHRLNELKAVYNKFGHSCLNFEMNRNSVTTRDQ